MVEVDVRAVGASETDCELLRSGCLQEDPSGADPKTEVVNDDIYLSGDKPLYRNDPFVPLGANSPAAPESFRGRGFQRRIDSKGFHNSMCSYQDSIC